MPAERRRDEAGVSLVEALVVCSLGLVLLLGAYQVAIASRQSYVRQIDQAMAQSGGRAALDLIGWDLRATGRSPLGRAFEALPAAEAARVRRVSDLDGDGRVAADEPDEDLTWLFRDPDGDGTYELLRGTDANGDGDLADALDAMDVVLPAVVPVDVDGDGLKEPFLAYDAPPPLTRRVTVSFGVRAERRDVLRRAFPVAPFHDVVLIRNRVGPIG